MSTKKVQVIGLKGEDGVGISSVKQTTTSTEQGGENVITITLTDGKTSTVKIQNGKTGETGAKGDTPERGQDYWTAADIASMEQHCDSYVDEKFSAYVDEMAELLGGDA